MKQSYDPRNADIQVNIDGNLVHRDEAKVSVFDSLVQGGDGCWEGLRVYQGKVFRLDHHLDRLVRGVVDTRSVVLLATVTLVALRAAVLALEHERLT